MPIPENDYVPQDFDRPARLFPLPDLVLFPHVLQPLHIFEKRYRAMIDEAVADDRLVVMALLKPGWEKNYEGCPATYPHGCLGRIATHHRLDDGRYNLLLHGVCRVVVRRELPMSKLFREAIVEPCWDLYPPETAACRGQLQRELLAKFKQILPDAPESQHQLDQLLGSSLSLGALTDVVAYTLDLPLATKYRLLSEANVDLRAELLLDRLRCLTDDATSSLPRRPFPPEFSVN